MQPQCLHTNCGFNVRTLAFEMVQFVQSCAQTSPSVMHFAVCTPFLPVWFPQKKGWWPDHFQGSRNKIQTMCDHSI